jgi:hypothetical protein
MPPCEKHPDFRGIRLGKRRRECPGCVAYYEEVHADKANKETRRRTSKEDVARILDLAASGRNEKEIVAELGFSAGVVHYHLTKGEKSDKPATPAVEEKAEAQEEEAVVETDDEELPAVVEEEEEVEEPVETEVDDALEEDDIEEFDDLEDDEEEEEDDDEYDLDDLGGDLDDDEIF